MKQTIETTTEWCAECDHEVELSTEFKAQICPNCKKRILPCSICEHGHVEGQSDHCQHCDTCPLEPRRNRKPMYESDTAKALGLMAVCNSCDRIIYEDENDREDYVDDGRGYCKECRNETDQQERTPIT